MSGFYRNQNGSRSIQQMNFDVGHYFYSNQMPATPYDYRYEQSPNYGYHYDAFAYYYTQRVREPVPSFAPQHHQVVVDNMGMYSPNMQNPRFPNRGRHSRGGRGRGSRTNSRNQNRGRDGPTSDETGVPTARVEETSPPADDCGPIVDNSSTENFNIGQAAARLGDHSMLDKDMNQREDLERQLGSGSYECMICYNTIRRQVAIWSCNNCYHIFHLFCIKKWSQSMKIGVAPISPSAEELARSGHKVWRCPACQKEHTAPGFTYVCFCGKSREPEHSLAMTPHTCGEVCGKSRGERCPHKCLLPCHPGPCPPCDAIVRRPCLCGAASFSGRCGSSSAMQCAAECGRLLACGVHRCSVVCHAPPCAPCDRRLAAACHCGKSTRHALCGSDDAGAFSCGARCEKPLACGEHVCRLLCHSGACPPCARAVATVVTCPCGRVPIGDLQPAPRLRCSDAIPTCEAGECDKPLPCGHACPARCHDGECPPCAQARAVTCRCGKSGKQVACTEWDAGAAGEFLCQRRCRKKKRCGRCRCAEVCCIDLDHVCGAVCGKTLSCGRHACPRPCHLGRCGPCDRVSAEPLSCECGAAVLPPPVACGQPRPECQRPCARQHACEHPVRHRCHAEPACPPCTFLVSKPCLGGHTERHNIPCHQRSVTCGLACGRALPDCSHRCERPCHDADCIPAGQRCRQPCSVVREDCGHPCRAPCHEGEACPGGQCAQMVEVTCACGLRKKKVSCHSLTTMNKWQLWGALQGSQSSNASIDVDQLSKNSRQLECDSVCAQVERNRAFAEALNISDADPTPTPGAPNYSRWLKDFARGNFDFANGVEKNLDELLRLARESKHKSRSHSFPVMNRDKRRFVHELAEFYFCETQSYDAEPNRSVVVTAKKDRCRMPTVRMSAVVQQEIHADAKLSGRAVASGHVIRPSLSSSASASGFQVLGRVSAVPVKREIDYFED